MANEEQLKILKQGIKVWNKWRKEHPDEKIDLERADLSWAILRGVILREAELCGANLSGAYLRGTDLSGTNLEGGDLSGARLREANLCKAYLCGADLRRANLVQINLSQASIAGVNLYGTARDDWKIDGIKCDYVFWDAEGKERTPKDRDFRPGEFEELYKQLPTFDYYFEHGFTALDAVVMSRIVEAINEQYPEFELKLDSFHSRGQPHTKFTVLHKEYVEAAKSHVTTDYESRIAALEGKTEQLMKMFAMVGSGNITMQSVGGNVIIQQAGRDIVARNKEQRSITAGRDYHERIEGQAQVTTGPSIEGDHAQQHITRAANPLLEDLPPLEHLTTTAALQEQYQLLSEKIHVMRKEYILETDVAIKFKLEKHLEEAEQFLKKIERQLSKVE